VVDDGETGILFEPGDAAGLARAMTRLWRDPDLALRMGRKGREKAEREYDGEVYCTRLERVYESVLARTPPRVTTG
jgi:glycosyltransferase involved in cell wall biosynthesis